VTSQLDHPGVVPVHDVGLDAAGKVWFTMRQVKGRTASEVFAEAFQGVDDWTTTRALEVILKVCDTMSYAHEKGVLHRDLKPANVMVGRFGEVYVMDWGLAKVIGQPDLHDLRIRKEATLASELDTARRRDADAETPSSVVSMDGQQLGTPSYMAPEQARGEGLDERADVYSIGAMLYELLTGQAPYATPGLRKPAYRILDDVVYGPPRRIEEIQKGVPAELVAIAERAMARERSKRYAHTTELADEVRAYLAQRTVKAYRTGALVEMRLWVRRNRPLAASLAAALLLLAGGSVLFGLLQQQTAKAEAAAAADAQNQLFRDVQLLADARRDEAGLYPAWPELVPKMEAWLRDRARPLAAKLPDWEQQLAQLEEKSTPLTAEQREARIQNHPQRQRLDRLRTELHTEDHPDVRADLQRDAAALEVQIEADTFEFADAVDQYRHRILSQLVRELREFVRGDTMLGVEQRLAAAKVVREQTIVAHQAKWDEAIAAIEAADGVRASAAYAKLPPKLVAQVGLVPLQMDPESKLWEFVHLASGTPGKQFPARDPATQRLVPTGDMGFVFVLIPGGWLPVGTKDEGSDTSVRLDKRLGAFFLSKYEMTQGQWLRLTKSNPSWSKDQNNLALPVESVNWFDSEQVLRQQGFMLPTEMRWEYACRAGTSTLWWTGDDKASLVERENIGQGASQLLAVGSKRPNKFGLFDMSGNLWEWCLDVSTDYGTEADGDGLRPDPTRASSYRCSRGGYFGFDPLNAQSGFRVYYAPSYRDFSLGLRPARTVRL
jgi:formylglycine-generating enzyme required for sulfatase activity